MIKATTLARDAQRAATTINTNKVAQDISAALHVAQNFDHTSNNQTSHVMISSHHQNDPESLIFNHATLPNTHRNTKHNDTNQLVD